MLGSRLDRAATAAALLSIGLTSLAAADDRWFVAPLIGDWSITSSWSDSIGGPGGASVPGLGDVARLRTIFATDAPICLFPAGSPTTPILTRIELTGPGTAQLAQGGGTMRAEFVDVATNGGGTYTLNGGTLLPSTLLRVGSNIGSNGLFDMSGGTLSSPLAYIGQAGDGRFECSGGTATIDQVFIGRGAGSEGTWAADGGTLIAQKLSVGFLGFGVWDQDAGDTMAMDFYVGELPAGDGVARLDGGTLVITSGAIGSSGTGGMTVSGGTLTAASLAVGGPQTAGNGSLVLEGGTVTTETLLIGTDSDQGSGTVRVSPGGDLDAEVARVDASGSLVVDAGGTVDGTSLRSDGSLAIAGRVEMSLDAEIFGTAVIESGGRLAATTMTIFSTADVLLDGGNLTGPGSAPFIQIGTLVNEGRLELSEAGVLMDVVHLGEMDFGSPSAEIAGGLDVDALLTIPSGVTLTVGAGSAEKQGVVNNDVLLVDGELRSPQGGVENRSVIEGFGRIEGGLFDVPGDTSAVRPGRSAIAATMEIAGGLALRSSTFLNLDLGGTASGASDRLACSGTGDVQMEARVLLQLIDGYIPSAGDAIRVLSWPLGTPTTIDPTQIVFLGDLPAGLAPAIVELPTGMDVRFVEASLCPADVTGNGTVDFADLLALLSAFGQCALCPGDIDLNGSVDFGDVLAVLSAWGPCPS
ncbi:MAG: hypothetical protein AB8G96_04375 [Phycisphaerales bacterium]